MVKCKRIYEVYPEYDYSTPTARIKATSPAQAKKIYARRYGITHLETGREKIEPLRASRISSRCIRKSKKR